MNRLALEVVAIIGLALLGATCIITVGGQNAASRPRPEPVVKVAPPTAAPTVTAVANPPTAVPPTEIPPTVAPEPTPAPEPTLGRVQAARATAEAKPKPEPKPAAPSTEVQAYLDWLQPKLQIVGQASTALGGQFDQFNKTPALFFNQEWKLKTGIALGFLRAGGEGMRSEERAVPQAVAGVDVDVRSLGNELVLISEDYATGLDKLDAERFKRGNTRMQNATQSMNRLTPRLQALQKP